VIRHVISYCLALVVNFRLSFLLTPWARSFSQCLGLVDTPDGDRNMRREPIPVGGGSSLMHFPFLGQGRDYEVQPQGNVLWGELWTELQEECNELGLQSLHLDVNFPALYEDYHAKWNKACDGISIERGKLAYGDSLSVFGRIAVAGQRDEWPSWQKIATLSRLSEEFAGARRLFNGVSSDPVHTMGVAEPHRNGFMSEPPPTREPIILLRANQT
jgi:hypothetical protein